MASRGFEFAYMLDHGGTPTVKDWAFAADTGGYRVGDLLVLDTAGRADKAAANATIIFGVCAQADTTSVAEDTELKVYIGTRSQVWKCSMDASSTALVKGYDNDVDIVDHNTVDADGSGSGGLILFDTGTDDDGNVLAYVVFNSTIFDGQVA